MAQEILCPQRGRKYYSVQGFDNPIEYTTPRIYHLVPHPPAYPVPIMQEPYNPGYTINPETGGLEWQEWPYISNPSYPGHFQDKPIRTLPQDGQGGYHSADTYSLIAIGIQSETAEIYGTAGNPNWISTLNPPYEGVPYKNKDIAKVSIFREGQLININQRDYLGATELPQIPPKPANPNDEWLFVFNTYQKNAALIGQEVYCTFGVWWDSVRGGYLNGKIISQSSGTEYDTITISVSSGVNYGDFYNLFSCKITKPVKLKCQVTGLFFDENINSETVGRQDINFEIYEIENRVEGIIGNWKIEWQTKTLVPYYNNFTGQNTYDISSSNYVQNENYTARLSYRYNGSPESWISGQHYYNATYELYNSISDIVVLSDTDFLKSGYKDTYYNCKWKLTEDEENNRPWKNNTISFKYYFWTTVLTTTYTPYTAYPNYEADPEYPWGGRPTDTFVNTIEEGESISITFDDTYWTPLTPYSPNYNPSEKSDWGVKPTGELTTTNYEMKYREYEYEHTYIEFTFYLWDGFNWYPNTRIVPTYSMVKSKEIKNVNKSLQDEYTYSMMSIYEYKELYGGDATFPSWGYTGNYIDYGNYYGSRYLNYEKPLPNSFLP